MSSQPNSQYSVLVTGADGHLGKHAVSFFLRNQYKVVATSYSDEGKESTLDFLKSALTEDQLANLIDISVVDLSDESAVQQSLSNLHQKSHQLSGHGIGYVVNAAGGFVWNKLTDISNQEISFLMSANFYAPLFLLRTLLPKFDQQGFGRFVFVSAAITGDIAGMGMGVYSASKAALNKILESAGNEVDGDKITINAVMPQIIDTPRNRQDMPDADFTSWHTPEAVCEKILGLLSSGARDKFEALS